MKFMEIVLERVLAADPETQRIDDAEDKARQDGQGNEHENINI